MRCSFLCSHHAGPRGTLVEPSWNPRGTLPQSRPGPPRSLSGLRPQSFRLLGKYKYQLVGPPVRWRWAPRHFRAPPLIRPAAVLPSPPAPPRRRALRPKKPSCKRENGSGPSPVSENPQIQDTGRGGGKCSLTTKDIPEARYVLRVGGYFHERN